MSCTKKGYYKDDLAKILASAKTDGEKTYAIFEFVKSKIKWNGGYDKYPFNGVKKAYKESSGNVADVNLVLTAMLRAAGLNANPVLISSRGNGIPLFPTNKGFDYVISMVKFPDNSYALLDATELYSLPNLLPARALNWNGMAVYEGGGASWVKLTSTKNAKQENMVMVKLNEDLEVEGMARTKFENLNALLFRKSNNHIKEEEMITKFEESNSLEVDDFSITNKFDLGKPVVRKVKFSSEDLIEQISGKIYIEPLLFLTKRKNPFKLKERKFPVDFVTAWEDSDRVTIEIPEGYKVEFLPETKAIALPDNLGVFKYQVMQTGNKIRTLSSLKFNKPMIPAQYYEYLKMFYAEVVAKETEKVVLVKI